MKLSNIAIYPAKGFPAYTLDTCGVKPDGILSQDRRFTFALSQSQFGHKKWLSKGKLLQILNTNLLSGLDAQFQRIGDDNTWQLNIKHDDGALQSFVLPKQGVELATFLSKTYERDFGFLDGEDTTAYADQKTPLISLLNLGSVADMALKSNLPMSWQRLRGNLMIDNMEAWRENELVGKILRIGQAEFEVVKPVGRCAAPGVNLQGIRDLDLLDFMLKTYDHTDCGLFLKALNTAEIKIGDALVIT